MLLIADNMNYGIGADSKETTLTGTGFVLKYGSEIDLLNACYY